MWCWLYRTWIGPGTDVEWETKQELLGRGTTTYNKKTRTSGTNVLWEGTTYDHSGDYSDTYIKREPVPHIPSRGGALVMEGRGRGGGWRVVVPSRRHTQVHRNLTDEGRRRSRRDRKTVKGSCLISVWTTSVLLNVTNSFVTKECFPKRNFVLDP